MNDEQKARADEVIARLRARAQSRADAARASAKRIQDDVLERTARAERLIRERAERRAQELVPAFRFMQELRALEAKYGMVIEGCGCCGSPTLGSLERIDLLDEDEIDRGLRGEPQISNGGGRRGH